MCCVIRLSISSSFERFGYRFESSWRRSDFRCMAELIPTCSAYVLQYKNVSNNSLVCVLGDFMRES